MFGLGIMKEIIINKEDAVFWMDANGRWHNQHGEFEHKRVIDYFNRSIDHDADGYFVSQQRGELIEKVYFPYEETALFVVEITSDTDIWLRLNTGKKIALDPKSLMIKNDFLFIQNGNQLIKFNDRSMLKLSNHFEEKDGQFQIRLNGQNYPIRMA
jgi:hypothetical protein